MLINFVGFLKGDTNLTEKGSFSATYCSNCKHFLNSKKARGSGALKFCGEDGKESYIFDVKS